MPQQLFLRKIVSNSCPLYTFTQRQQHDKTKLPGYAPTDLTSLWRRRRLNNGPLVFGGFFLGGVEPLFGRCGFFLDGCHVGGHFLEIGLNFFTSFLGVGLRAILCLLFDDVFCASCVCECTSEADCSLESNNCRVIVFWLVEERMTDEQMALMLGRSTLVVSSSFHRFFTGHRAAVSPVTFLSYQGELLISRCFVVVLLGGIEGLLYGGRSLR